MPLTPNDFSAILVTARLAATTTALLLVLGTPLAWWLARSHSILARGVDTLVALPLVLPPTVLGFYLLVALGPQGPVGAATQALGLGTLPFTFAGLVIGSLLYSLPFAVQPLKTAFVALGQRHDEAAATLGAGPVDRFFSISLPLARGGLITAGVLTFAHTVGEFGVVLMIGGSIPETTRVLSVAIYDHVEALDYARAHILSAGLLGFSFVVLFCLHLLGRRPAEVLT